MCVFVHALGKTFSSVGGMCFTCELKRRYTKWFALLRLIISSFIIFTFRIHLCTVSQTINRPFETLATCYNYWKNERNKNSTNFSITLSSFSVRRPYISPHSFMIFVWQQSDIVIDRRKLKEEKFCCKN